MRGLMFLGTPSPAPRTTVDRITSPLWGLVLVAQGRRTVVSNDRGKLLLNLGDVLKNYRL